MLGARTIIRVVLLVALSKEHVLGLVATPTRPQLRYVHHFIEALFIFIQVVILLRLCIAIVLVHLALHIIEELVSSLESA